MTIIVTLSDYNSANLSGYLIPVNLGVFDGEEVERRNSHNDPGILMPELIEHVSDYEGHRTPRMHKGPTPIHGAKTALPAAWRSSGTMVVSL
jgi:hypothetical protein